MSDRATPFRRFFVNRRGSVAIELALVMPVLMLMVVGFHEAYMYVRAVGLVERTAASVADIMGRQIAVLVDCSTSDDAANLGTYVTAAVEMARPIDLARSGQVFLSSVLTPTPAQGQNPAARVAWQRSSTFMVAGERASVGRQGAAATLPAGILPDVGGNDTVMVVEILYRFTPFAMTARFWNDAPGTVTIRRSAYFRSRLFNQNRLAPGCAGLPTPT